MNNEIIISNHTPQDITISQKENQLIFINGGGEVIGITDVKVNGTSVVTNNVAYIIVPTTTSQLTNNSGYITINDIPNETDPTVPYYVKTITRADINNWNNKQDQLVSGTNIKTINNTSLLGSGNIDITGGESYIAGTGIQIENGVISNTITNYNDLTDLPTIPNKTSDLINDEDFVSKDDLAEVAFTGSYNSLSDTPVIPSATSDLTNDSDFIDSTDLSTALSSKQDTLVSGTNIKTINNNSLLGSGNISISGGTATDVQVNGTSIVSNNTANIITESAYNSTTNKIATKEDTLEIYSTNEIAIGKWINNETLYRKVIAISLPNTGATSFSTGLSNINVISLIGNVKSGATCLPVNFNNAVDVGTSIHCFYDNGNLYVGCSFNGSSFSGYVILEYTKN